MKPKCFICGEPAKCFIFSKNVCRSHFGKLKLIRKDDKPLWDKIKKCLGD